MPRERLNKIGVGFSMKITVNAFTIPKEIFPLSYFLVKYLLHTSGEPGFLFLTLGMSGPVNKTDKIFTHDLAVG